MDMVLVTLNSTEAGSELLAAWQKIAHFRPRIRPHIRFYQHQYRGRNWSVLADESTGSYFRCTGEDRLFLLYLNGTHTIEQAYSKAYTTSENSSVKQEQLVLLIGQLKAADLLQGDFPLDIHEIAQRGIQMKRRSRWQQWLRPFSVKLPLFDPDRFLSQTVAYVAPIFHPAFLLLWLVIIMGAGATAILNSSELLVHWQSRFTDPINLFSLMLLYPLIKSMHELGHAYATKKWGGEVHEIGVMFLVFQPVPYVNTSASHRFECKWHRIIVGAAGIMVELLIASIALLYWASAESGSARDIAFNLAIIGGVSTLFFNGNPLLRFDGYYILSDLIEIPNLASRSNQYLGYLIRRYMFGLLASRSPITADGERCWFIGYGITSGFYRLFVSFTIALWVATQFFIIGVILAAWALITQVFYPALSQFFALIPEVMRANKIRQFSFVSCAFIALVVLSLTVPIPHSTFAKGIIILPENALIRAESEGIVTAVQADNGIHVRAGTPLLTLENLPLQTKLEVLHAKQKELRARQKAVILNDRTQSAIFNGELDILETEISEVRNKIQNLTIKSPLSGILSLPLAIDLPGRFITKGEVIGHIVDLTTVNAQVIIPQTEINRIRHNTKVVKVKVNSQPGETLTAKIVREVPLASNQLPSKILGSQAGGDIIVDARDEHGVQALSNVFQLDISLPLKASGNYLGQRVSVRFIHSSEPLAFSLFYKMKLFAHYQFLN